MYLCLFLVSYSSQAQKKKAALQQLLILLKEILKVLKTEHTVKLIPGATHSSEAAVAETTLKDGKFTFTGKLKEPRLFYVAFGKKQRIYSCFS